MMLTNLFHTVKVQWQSRPIYFQFDGPISTKRKLMSDHSFQTLETDFCRSRLQNFSTNARMSIPPHLPASCGSFHDDIYNSFYETVKFRSVECSIMAPSLTIRYCRYVLKQFLHWRIVQTCYKDHDIGGTFVMFLIFYNIVVLFSKTVSNFE